MCKTVKKFTPGEVVMFSTPFLRSISDHSAATANRRFEVVSVSPVGVGRNSLVSLRNMRTGEGTKALASNLELATTRR